MRSLLLADRAAFGALCTYLLFVIIITNLYPLEQARRLIMNEDLDVGTAIPEIMMALEQGYGVLVMNTNDNHR